jgi:carboxypeptidase PM20D1
MSLGKKLLAGLALLVVGLGVSAGINTATMRSHQPAVTPPEVPALSSEAEAQLAQRLAGALRIKTISQEGQPVAAAELRALHAYLREQFPALHAALQLEMVGELSLLYTWPGQDPSARPYLLLAHQDVVPIEAGSESRWLHPPFAGEIAGGYVWGRGALDDKGSVVAILEAVEQLVRSGYKPQRTVYLAFGHDEELSGLHGAHAIAARLQERGVRLDFVLDEGMVIADGMMPGARQPVALIGLAEKGYLSVELLAKGSGGHSSLPPAHTSVGVLSRAVRRVEDHPLPTVLRPPASQLLGYVGPELSGPLRFVFTNLWLLRPVLLWQFAQQSGTAAMIRTTTAATMFEGGPKDNVLPQRARAVINFRVLPGDTTAQVLDHVRRVIDDPEVEVTPIAASRAEPSPVSSDTSPSFATLMGTVRSVFPHVLAGPTLMLGQSDARHFSPIADNSYRFLPVTFNSEDLDRLHGTNERIGVKAYAESVRFYGQLVRSADRQR